MLMHKGKTGKHFLFYFYNFCFAVPLTPALTQASVSAAPGPTFNTLKEELLFRHQLAAGAGTGDSGCHALSWVTSATWCYIVLNSDTWC